jgi:2-polyprenyl-3-methyl-5-hydroxy-6-metoxy-1,4-benzoquinol methylase
MYEKLEICPSCNSKYISNHSIVKDLSISQESFALSLCKTCTLLFTNPRPTQEQITRFYESDNYISHVGNSTGFRALVYRLVRKYTLYQKHQLIKNFTAKKSLLDYGSGTGSFLNYMLARGYAISGIEPHANARANTPSTIVPFVKEKLSSATTSVKHDIITAWHVFEHVHELHSTIKGLRKALTDNGYMFVALPNHESPDAKYYKQYWAGYDVPRHLYHFDKQAFTHLVADSKLKVIKILPMHFDAYYVSMLSEQYQQHSIPFVRGLVQGYLSNRSASQSLNYSSLIYVLQKV